FELVVDDDKLNYLVSTRQGSIDAKKPNPFIDLEVEVDAQDERDLDEAEADNEFDDCEDYGEEDPPTTEDREDDEDLDALLDDDEE
ncbi:hypothetical protein DXG01_014163, partial [Tephrocybe rancida]